MKGQPCLIESLDPLPDGRDYEALCRKKIIDAYFGMSWDSLMMGSLIINAVNICPRCIESLIFLVNARREAGEPNGKKRYLYGAINGSEVKRRGDEE